MPKIMLHNSEARRALARGVQRLCRRGRADARPQGPERHDRPADRHAADHPRRRQHRRRDRAAEPVREHGRAGRPRGLDADQRGRRRRHHHGHRARQRDGAAAGSRRPSAGAKAVDLCRGIDLAVAAVVAALKASAKPAKRPQDPGGGRQHRRHRCQARRAGRRSPSRGSASRGVITTEYGVTTETVLEVVEGMSFDRGYLSHHMVTDPEKMEAVLETPYILMTDLKIKTPDTLGGGAQDRRGGRPAAADHRRGDGAGRGGDAPGQAGAGPLPGRPSAGIRALAQVHARGPGHHDRRQGDRARSRRPARGDHPRGSGLGQARADHGVAHLDHPRRRRRRR